MFDLTTRCALITGAGRGMGVGIAQALGAHGAQIFINDLIAERAEHTAAKLRAKHINATAIAADITDAKARQTLKKDIGTVDILVNNAGVPESMPTSLRQAADLTEADYQTQLDLNYHAIRELCRLFVPAMRAQQHGRILIITSESHRLGLALGLSHYAGAKAATLGYMRALAAELGHDGITINALSLGTMNNFDGHERAAISTLVGRAGTPQDVGAAALYLCSDEASWITGQTLALNGGACTA